MNKISTIITSAVLTFGVSSATNAFNKLQLDAQDGVYGGGTPDTTVCSTETCDFYAIANNKKGSGIDTVDILGDPDAGILAPYYYVSIAVIDADGPPAPNLGDDDYGSFDLTIDGTTVTIDVTGNMVFGTPPLETLEALQGSDPLDITTHGIFETYFTQIAITFAADQTLEMYNVQDEPGTAEEHIASGETHDGFYERLTINTAGLDEGLNLHLDLYNTTFHDCKNPELKEVPDGTDCTDVDAALNAPYSHDAETGSSGTPGEGTPGEGTPGEGTGVPEPSTLALLGLGMIGGLFVRRQRAKKA